MILRQRQPRIEEPKFLAFIRRQSCVGCSAPPPSQAAHLRLASIEHGKRECGKGEKPDDRWANPLCQECHLDGPQSQHRIGERRFWARAGTDPFQRAGDLYKAFTAISGKDAGCRESGNGANTAMVVGGHGSVRAKTKSSVRSAKASKVIGPRKLSTSPLKSGNRWPAKGSRKIANRSR